MDQPKLTAEDRAAAAAAALAARRRRAEIKAQLAAGDLTLAQALDIAEADRSVAKMRVSDMLQALPRIGPIKAGEIMERTGVSKDRRIRGLGHRQRAALLADVEGE